MPSTFSSSPQCYGGIELTNDEEKALCLPPKFAVYDRVDLTSCEAQIEKGLAKLRWSMIRRADSGPDEGEGEKERVWPFDLETKTFDLHYLRPTDIPFNNRVCLPDALEDDKEIDMQHLKGKLIRATKEYIGRETDKSSRFAVDTLDNYCVACQPHVENDPTVTEELHEKAQAEANAHSVLWVRILNAGEGVGGQARIKSNMLVWKEEESVCLNTEEMLADFKRLNDSHISEDIIVGSADVKALNPSLDITFTVEKVCEVFHTSGVQVVGINAEELGLYLALNRTETELTDVGLLQFCPRRKTRRGRPPTITGCALDENKTKRFKPWLPPAEEPDENTTRKMFTEAMKIVLLFIMKNHYYTFDNQVKLQSRGGPHRVGTYWVLAQLFMVWWDRQFMKRVAENGLKVWVYKRYVDDIDVIMNAPRAGLRFVESECKLVQSIGNSIHPSIELEVDYPSEHGDGKLPILDLKVWVEKRRRETGSGQEHDVNVVLHEFYSKDIASTSVVNARSALPWSCKRMIHRKC
ncbi:hypothetical protein OS493_030283 [Desmophyllum pertusum]|uniref:Reverse transcriptase domain-containing protein n=1 Tax=Desmophyllum pertusum TaxID=174260 RepID=A0A9W9ZXL6_9CNID|nr:hypothetical protein OS493_030283 [Desmophyllum pertusum]